MLCQMALIYDRASFGSKVLQADLRSGFPWLKVFTREIKARCSAMSQTKGPVFGIHAVRAAAAVLIMNAFDSFIHLFGF